MPCMSSSTFADLPLCCFTRLEQPLGGLQQFHVSHMDGREPSSPPPQLQHHEHPIAAAAAQQQQRRHLQALEAQLVANLQEQPLPPQHPRHHQQQQQPLDVRYLQHQMALWQAQRDAAAQAEARAAQAALAANRQSAFHATTHGGAAPSAGLPLAFGLGGSSVQEAAAAYLAAAAAGAHTLQLGMPGHPPPHAQAAAARAKVAHRSPDTSDSDTDAAAALTGMKRGRLLRSPARPAAGAEQLWRTSAGSEDSAATASMVSLPQPAPSLQPLSATAPASDLWPAAVSRPAAAAKALAVRHNAPLPPADQPHIPRRARTRTTLPADADGVAAAGAMALAGPLVEFQPPRGDLEEIKQWSSRILAMMLMLRAAGFRA